MTGRTCTRDGCDDFDACKRAVNGWQGELAFCENDDMPETEPEPAKIDWSEYESLYGTMSDYKIAKLIGCLTGMVAFQRHRRGIPIYADLAKWPDQKCECGCGQITKRAQKTSIAKGWIRGKPLRFIDRHQGRIQRERG